MKELSDQKFGQQDQYNIVDDNQINAMLQMKQYARNNSLRQTLSP